MSRLPSSSCKHASSWVPSQLGPVPIESPAISLVFRPLTYYSPFTLLLYFQLVPWTHNRIFPESPAILNSESSFLEEQMQGKLPSYNAYVIPPRVRRSTGLVHKEIESQYVLIPTRAFNLIIHPVSNRRYDRGETGLFLLGLLIVSILLVAWPT
jgi:hypothetical protein